MLEVKGVSVSYKGVKILNEVSLTTEPGEVCALVTPNGSGKTTLLKVMGAHLIPSRGRCEADGISSVRRPAAYRNKVMRIPDAGKLLHDDLTVYEHLEATRIIWRSEADLSQVADECLIAGMLSKRGKELSQGMKQQVSLAIACMSAANYILFDEPTNGFDQSNARRFWHTIEVLAEKGRAILISSHILSELDDACDSTYFLKDGRLIRPHDKGYQGSSSDIYAQLYEGEQAVRY